MSNPRTPYPLRIPEPLRDWMKEKAEQNSRSLQGELIYRLMQSKALEESRAMSPDGPRAVA